MGLLDDVKGMLTQYATGAAPAGDAAAHFDQMARSVDPSTIAQGLAAAMRSSDTPPFAQMVSHLFANGNTDQKLAMLGTLLSSMSPEQQAHLSSLIPGLGGITSGTSSPNAIPPSSVQSLAEKVEQHDPGIIEKMSSLYAEHPTLVKMLGSAAMMIALRTIAQRHLTA